MSTPERHAPVFAPQVQPPTTRSQPVSDAYANSTEEQMPPFRMLNVLIAKESPGSQALIEDEDIEDYVRTAVVLRVAAAVVPFVPTRVSTAFSRGLLNASTMASTIPQNLVSTSSPRTPRLRSEFVAPPLVTSCPEPRPLAAAVLLVDVSGFTRLSEEARRRAGSDGAERFAVALSAFFARITQVTASFSGDVDCFAGDALLVLFEPLPQSGGRKLGPEQRLRSAADRALACARAVHQHLDGFQHEPGDPPLRIHSALAVGNLFSLECGGDLAGRSEALVIGEPLIELGAALRSAGQSELALAPSAHRLLGASQWVSRINSSSLVPLACRRLLGREFAIFLEAGLTEDCEYTWAEENRCLIKQVANYADLLSQKSLGTRSNGSRGSFVELSAPTIQAISLLEASKDDSRRSSSSSTASSSCGDRRQETAGLEALLRFTPSFVRSRCVQGQGLDTLMEHRTVTSLFIIAEMQGHRSRYGDLDWLIRLQTLLGGAIDLVEGQMGGATRQITMDDKGLAMIFVFGLPGYKRQTQQAPAILAACKVVEALAGGGIYSTAGISCGMCFCGVIGNPSIRCEYAVMGDVVNTSARLAVAASKQGEHIFCTDVVAQAATQETLLHGVVLMHAGNIPLKGKQGLAAVYVPTVVPSVVARRRLRAIQPVEAVGRDREMGELMALLDASTSDAPSFPLMTAVVEGPSGIGKTALIEHFTNVLMQKGRSVARLGGTHHRVLNIRGTQDSTTPFLMCRNILKWLLELDVEEEGADELSWLVGDFNLDDGSLPKVMRPYCERLAEVQDTPSALRESLQALYTDIIWDALMARPLAMLLDDVHQFDEASAAVLEAVVQRGCSAAAHRVFGEADAWQSPSLIVVTSRTPLSWQNSDEHTCARRIELKPLADEEVVAIACRTLQCTTLAPEIQEAVLRRAQGVPLYVVEASLWLRTQRLEVGGQLAEEAVGRDLASAIPPSLRNMVQSVVDHLPPGPGVVVRCASVLGTRFSQSLLQQLLPSGVAATEEGMGVALRVLESLKIVSRSVQSIREQEEEHLGGEAGEEGGKRDDIIWVFNHELQQEVVYGSMAHRYRRALHRQAARLLRQRAASVESILRQQPLLQEQAWHWEKVVLGFEAGQSTRQEDMDALATLLEEAATNSQTLGNFTEAFTYRSRLLRVLQHTSSGRAKAWQIHMELNIIQKLLHSILLPAIHSSSLRSMEAKYDELLARQAKLLSSLGNLPRSSIEATDPTDSSPSAIPLQRHVQLHRQITRILKVFVTSNGLLPPAMVAEHERIMADDELRSVEKAFLGCHLVIGNRNTLPPHRLAVLAEEALSAFDDAGWPTHIKSIAGAPLTLPIYMGLCHGQLCSGQLGASFEARAIAHLPSLGMHAPVLLNSWEMTEITCDWLHSRRIQAIHDRRLMAGSPLKMGETMVKAQVMLLDASTLLRERWGMLFEGASNGSEDGEAAAGDLLKEWDTLMHEAGLLARPSGFQGIRILGIVRYILHVGCRLVVDEDGDGKALSRAGWGLLRSCTTLLASGVKLWEERLLNVHGSATYSPSALLMSRAMLHWFTWLLHAAGQRHEPPEPAVVPKGITGVCPLAPSPHRAGLPAVVASLLLAQRRAVEDCEILSVAVPSSLWLARLMASQHRDTGVSGLGTSAYGGGCFVPERLPGVGCTLEESVRVRHVQFGSPQAFRVARQYLSDVVGLVSVHGRPLDITAVRSLADVADSASVWELVQVHRQLGTNGAAD